MLLGSGGVLRRHDLHRGPARGLDGRDRRDRPVAGHGAAGDRRPVQPARGQPRAARLAPGALVRPGRLPLAGLPAASSPDALPSRGTSRSRSPTSGASTWSCCATSSSTSTATPRSTSSAAPARSPAPTATCSSAPPRPPSASTSGWTREQVAGTSVLRLDGAPPTSTVPGPRPGGYVPGGRTPTPAAPAAGTRPPLAGALPRARAAAPVPPVPPLRPAAPVRAARPADLPAARLTPVRPTTQVPPSSTTGGR